MNDQPDNRIPDSEPQSADKPALKTELPGFNREQVLASALFKVDNMVGKVLADRYEITELLGDGAMGIVYKAKQKLLDRTVAIKILKRDPDDVISRKRFENEARAAGSLMHPNLIAVHDYGFLENETPFLVMDYVEGESLAATLKREKRLSDDRMINVLKQICLGLAHAHNKGLVHRDLKPNNIILIQSEDGRDFVKIVDFGIAKPIDGDQGLTQTGQIFGTPLYMSPEQCQGHRLDGRSDIYSLGCLIYRLLSGRPPFCGENAVNTIVLHLQEPPPPLAPELLPTQAAQAIFAIAVKALAKAPGDRFQSADEMRIAFDNIDALSKEPGNTAKAAVVEPVPSSDFQYSANEEKLPSSVTVVPRASGSFRRWTVWLLFGCISCAVALYFGSQYFGKTESGTDKLHKQSGVSDDVKATKNDKAAEEQKTAVQTPAAPKETAQTTEANPGQAAAPVKPPKERSKHFASKSKRSYSSSYKPPPTARAAYPMYPVFPSAPPPVAPDYRRHNSVMPPANSQYPLDNQQYQEEQQGDLSGDNHPGKGRGKGKKRWHKIIKDLF